MLHFNVGSNTLIHHFNDNGSKKYCRGIFLFNILVSLFLLLLLLQLILFL